MYFSTFIISWHLKLCSEFVFSRNEIMYRLPTVLSFECCFHTFHMKNLLCIQHIFVRKSWSLYVIIMRHNTFNHLVTRNIMKPIDKIEIFSRIEWLVSAKGKFYEIFCSNFSINTLKVKHISSFMKCINIIFLSLF